jgi:hypothetical protein
MNLSYVTGKTGGTLKVPRFVNRINEYGHDEQPEEYPLKMHRYQEIEILTDFFLIICHFLFMSPKKKLK